MQITRRKFLINGAAGLAQLSITSALVTSLARNAQASNPNIVDVKGLYNVAGDSRGIEGTCIKKGQKTLQSNLANFQPSDVNKVVLVYGSVNGVPSKKIAFQTTVKSFDSSTQVTLNLDDNHTPPNDLYGRTIIGTDDTPNIKKAMQAAHANDILFFRQGNYMLTQQVPIGMNGGIKICGDADIKKTATFYNYGFSIAGPNCIIENLSFYGSLIYPPLNNPDNGPYGIYTLPSVTTAQNNFLIDHCTFTNHSSGIYLAADKNKLPTGNSVIQQNTFNDCYVGIKGDFPQSTLIAANTIKTTLTDYYRGGVLLAGGANNTIINNTVSGTHTVGISFIYDRSKSGFNGIVHNNTIASNLVSNTTEECISFDCRGSEALGTAALEYDKILSPPSNFKQTNNDSYCDVDLAHQNWNQAGSVYQGYYMVWLTGLNAGLVVKILGHNKRTFTVHMIKSLFDNIKADDKIVIGAPFFNNTVKNNIVDARNSTTLGIHLYGLCFSNTVTGNQSTGSGSPAVGNGSLVTVNVGSIGARSLNGLTQAGTRNETSNYTDSYGAAPSMNNTFSCNHVDKADFYADLHNYAPNSCSDYMSLGNRFHQCTSKGGSIKIANNQVLVS